MPDIIQLLPDSVANQIAAGEVIQRPASVVKELVENAIDAGSTSISVIIKDAGRTLIQVIDNGSGMSETDARMSFERHATSKIRSADDLFALRTMGFRGEALASIAAIAEVTLITRKETDEIGCQITLKATEVIECVPVACARGANFAVKNLFFNVPARRKFLKTDAHEFRMIVTEMHRITLANPAVEFKLIHNNLEVLYLTSGNHRQRINQLFGKNINQHLIDLKTNTTLVNVSGYICKPETAKKSQSEQFFFVNNRYMRHPYFHKAVMNAYERIILPDSYPSYFIFFELNPENIDVNIHPTKTEIKFEDEQAVWQILNASVKEALGKFSLSPTIDFDTEAAIEIPVLSKDTQIRIPQVNINPHFNPFDEDKLPGYSNKKPMDYFKQSNQEHWQSLFQGFENEPKEPLQQEEQRLFSVSSQESVVPGLMQLKGRYILSSVKSGLMLVDQKRAHERVLFEKYLQILKGSDSVSQTTLFPEVIELNMADYGLLMEYLDEINSVGFDIRSFGTNSVIVNGCPAEISDAKPRELVERLLDALHNTPVEIGEQFKEQMAIVLSKSAAINYGKNLSTDEMRDLIDRLFQCGNPNYSPDGKAVVSIINSDEIEKRFR